MRFLVRGLLGSVLVSRAGAQWYPPYSGYYPPYPNPSVTLVYPPVTPPPVVVNESPVLVIREYPEDYWQPQRITYLIAFKDSVIRSADAYWVRDNTLYYVTRDHRQMTAPLDSVDRLLTQRLNNEQNVPFYLPAHPGKAELRRLLEQQLNLILETRDTSRGLIVRISDVLFHFNDYTLTPNAREKLAKIAGILVAYSGLCPRLEGYTDSIGGDEYNLWLSRKRAGAVRDYLISQGVPAANLTAVGLGRADPVASNATAEGRQRNRRVEMLISGDVIGIAVTSTSLE
jgi:outer membrane protein OmpA-like peptidoglycan-associated protein